ncbi:adenylate/guanylate cyclase domain-containing protein [Algoriphagus sp. AK58]|uniref:adenylate/guanylate cyclase domain-containing protein n=1 Tax=Algoriphagus sp. AK58 TaxID=1406877 RepID=UPI00164FB76A|nr:tetratricopeptide repeat protein [Algoriphagus sp. AK58]MBC6365957.1 hypothetical protein [Algoriphagus sp. AK58]
MSQGLIRKQSVVYFSDIVGYTRLMGKDEDGAFQLMKDNLTIHKRYFEKFEGQLIKELGDGILGVFDSPQNAILASIEIQKEIIALGKFSIRIGMHCGDIIFDHGDVFGDAVNQSSRIQSVGVPSSILISEQLFNQLPKESPFLTIKLGGFSLKNVAQKVELHALTTPPLTVPKRLDILQNIRFQEKNPLKYGIGIGVIFLLLTLVIYSIFWNSSVWEKDKSVAVMPFFNLSGNPELDYFTDGLTENLIGQISKINSIKTISYSTMADFRSWERPLDSLANVLGVTTVLKGSVEELNSGYRFKLQLIDIAENKNIWTDEYSREGKDITQLQNEIARDIARVLDAKLTAEEVIQIGKGETSNAEAYDLLFRAKRLYYEGFGDPTLFFKAAELLKKAIELDPNYALAYTWLAKTYFQIAYDDPNGSWYDMSLEMSSKALELEPKLAEGYSARGIVYYDLGQYAKAKNMLETALSFYPNLSDAIGNLATIEFAQGNLLEALSLQTKSANLGPNSYLPYQNIAWIHKILGKFEEADQWFDKSLKISKNQVSYELKGMSLIEQGKKSDALKLLENLPLTDSLEYNVRVAGSILFFAQEYDSAYKVWDISVSRNIKSGFDKYYSTPINFSYLLKQRGDSQRADSLLNAMIQIKIEAISLGYEDYYLPLDVSTAYAIKNQKEEALKYLQIAYDRGWRDYFFTEFNPAFGELRNDSRYAKIIGQIRSDINQINQKLTSTSLQRDK